MITVNEFFNACSESNTDIVRQYIAEGGDINARNGVDWTALMLTANYGLAECVQELIASGADVNIKDNMGWTALMYALWNDRNTVAQILVELGADIYAKDRYGSPAIDQCKNKNITTMLIQIYRQRISTEAAIASSESPEIIKGFDTEK